MEDNVKNDLAEAMQVIRLLEGSINYLSQRVAWSETCFKQVQDSGAMSLVNVTRQIMNDHKKLQTQFKLLEMRVKALLEDSNSGGDQGGSPPAPPATLNRRFGL